MYLFQPILVITRPKKSYIGVHWGVEFPDGLVVDYLPEIGLRFTDRLHFADGMPVSEVRQVPWHLNMTVRARLEELQRNPRQYDLLAWNCETFAEWLTAGVPKSGQAALAIVGLAAALFFVFAK